VQQAINKWSPLKYPTYLFAARLESLDRWSRKPLLPTPKALAEAGFFTGLYNGSFTYPFLNYCQT
jgi:hypothetical protein